MGFEVSNTRSNISHVYEFNTVNERWDRLKFRITRSTSVTCLGNIWSRLKSTAIKILCCVVISLINRIKSSMKKPRRSGTRYTIINKIFSFSISCTTGNTSRTIELSITSRILTYSRWDIEPNNVLYSYGCFSSHARFHQYVLKENHLYSFCEAEQTEISWVYLVTEKIF